MDGLESLQRMPLAEAVLTLWRHVADEAALQEVFERYRGRCYEKVISFGLVVQLISDALLEHAGSGHQSFRRAYENDELPASCRAMYGKLSRMPIALSCGFFTRITDGLRDVFPPQAARQGPPSLEGLEIITLDGKAIKRVAKRMKALRTTSGGLLGGRALVAKQFRSGLALGLHADADGDANDVRFVPDLLPQLRERVPGTRLWLADRQFCDLVQMAHFTQEGDHFLIRYNAKVSFERDPDRPLRKGTDSRGRPYVEEWGWLGRATHRQRRYVRRIHLIRKGEEEIVVATDLLSADDYPAEQLLDLYLQRWGIEQMFQQVTEVFGLEGLIGGTPEATIFQLAFCLLLYNQIQLIRAYVAAHQKREAETISMEQLFIDVRRELVAWTIVIPEKTTLAYLEPLTVPRLVQRLNSLLRPCWSDRWIKATNRTRRSHPVRARTGTHGSVYRILRRQNK